MGTKRVVVIGAGIGGLAAALRLAQAGLDVTVLERGPSPGGKMRALPVGDALVEAGPTVFTMRWAFEELFSECGADLGARVGLKPANLLARHAWSADERLDLFADIDASAAAIGAFAGAREADGYRRFCARAAEVYRTLEGPFIRDARPSPIELSRRVGLSGLGDLWRIQPFTTLWSALGEYFRDPRLRQLFGRYATYCGCSPYAAPATLMLVAHVEQAGVWLVEGGLSALARAVADLATERGARFRYGAHVARIVTEGGRVAGVELSDGARVAADAVVANADVAALGAGLLGPAAMPAGDRVAPPERSLSAATFCLNARAQGFPLAHHTVFFSRDYRAEFDEILGRRRLPSDPTVYVCAQDRGDDCTTDPQLAAEDAALPLPLAGRGRGGGGAGGTTEPHPAPPPPPAPPRKGEESLSALPRTDSGHSAQSPERLLVLVNAPADGRERPFSPTEIETCETNWRRRLAACGLSLDSTEPAAITTPEGFEALFPGTGGALYGRAGHGWMASFKRPGARTKVPGLYLAGGSVHPGPGVPMAAQSGRLAAAALLADLASTARSPGAAMSGGTSTP